MSIDAILEASRAGMQNERLRMDVASRNGAAFTSVLGAQGQPQVVATRAVLDPGHPLADAQGMVHYPAVDMVQEMTTLLTASRGYEANVRSFNTLRSMVLKAMEIGAK